MARLQRWVRAALWVVVAVAAAVRAQTDAPTSPPNAVEDLALNDSVRSSTVGASRDILSSPDGQALAGQKVYRLRVPANTSLDVRISTCSNETDFDTILFLLDGDPFETSFPDLNTLSENAYDSECVRDKASGIVLNASTIEHRAEGGASGRSFYIVVTGSDDMPSNAEGNFELIISSGAPPSFDLSWGLDRIDQREPQLDGRFQVKDEGTDSWIYVIDSGIRRTHSEFGGRVAIGVDFVDGNTNGPGDCNGHGTHVAAIAAGRTFGVSRLANLVPVRILDCTNNGRVNDAIDAVEWVIDDVASQNRSPAVALMSLRTPGRDDAFNKAVQKMLDAGITAVVAAGNGQEDACLSSPASVEGAIVVGSCDRGTDARSVFSNFGSCVDMYAPGNDAALNGVPSAWYLGDFSVRFRFGTSQAAPYVAGTAANLLSANPELTPAEVKEILVSVSTKNSIDNAMESDNNRILFVRSIPENNQPPPNSGFIHIYFIARVFQETSCSEDVLGILRQGVVSSLDNVSDQDVDFFMCQAVFGRSSNASSSSQAIASVARQEEPQDLTITYRIETTVQRGKAVFEDLVAKLDSGSVQQETEQYDFNVTEDPWVVDSRGFIYWAAPEFEVVNPPRSLSTGAIIAIVLGSLALVAIIGLAVFSVRRRMRPSPVEQYDGMYGSADEASMGATFDDFENRSPRGANGQLPQNTFGRSFRGIGSFRNLLGGAPNTKNAPPISAQGPLSPERSAAMGLQSSPRFDQRSPNSLRITSMGGEAFATALDGLGGVGMGVNKPANGNGNYDNALATALSNQQAGEDAVRLQSLGGEAFAVSAGHSAIEPAGLLPRTSSAVDDSGQTSLPAAGLDTNNDVAQVETPAPTSAKPKPRLQPSTIRNSSFGEEALLLAETGTEEEQISPAPEELVKQRSPKESPSASGQIVSMEQSQFSPEKKVSNGGSSSVRRAGSNPSSYRQEALFVPGDSSGGLENGAPLPASRGSMQDRGLSFTSEGSETIIRSGVTGFEEPGK